MCSASRMVRLWIHAHTSVYRALFLREGGLGWDMASSAVRTWNLDAFLRTRISQSCSVSKSCLRSTNVPASRELVLVSRLYCAELNISFWGRVHRHRAGGLCYLGSGPEFGASTSRVRTDKHAKKHVISTTTTLLPPPPGVWSKESQQQCVPRSCPNTCGCQERSSWRTRRWCGSSPQGATPALVVETRGAEGRGCPRRSPSPQCWC